MKRVFLSYALGDADFARSLSQALSSDVEVASLETGIPGGEKIGEILRSQMATADVMVVLLSQNALGSPWLQFELGAALGLGVRVLPVYVGDPSTFEADKFDYLLPDQNIIGIHGLSPRLAADRLRDLIMR